MRSFLTVFRRHRPTNPLLSISAVARRSGPYLPNKSSECTPRRSRCRSIPTTRGGRVRLKVARPKGLLLYSSGSYPSAISKRAPSNSMTSPPRIFAGFGFAVAQHQPFGDKRLRLPAAFGKSGQFQEVAQGDVFVVFEIDSGFHDVPFQKEAVIVAPAAAVPKITPKPAGYPALPVP